MTITVTKGKTVKIDMTNINPGGGLGTSIIAYEWKVDGTLQSNNNPVFQLNTNNVTVGTHSVTMRIQNNCNTWSPVLTETVIVLAQTDTGTDDSGLGLLAGLAALYFALRS